MFIVPVFAFINPPKEKKHTFQQDNKFWQYPGYKMETLLKDARFVETMNYIIKTTWNPFFIHLPTAPTQLYTHSYPPFYAFFACQEWEKCLRLTFEYWTVFYDAKFVWVFSFFFFSHGCIRKWQPWAGEWEFLCVMLKLNSFR